MHKALFVGCLMCLSASLATAQGKVDSEWNCTKPTSGNSIDVGDQAGHAYAIAQFNCTAAKGEIAEAKEKEGVATEFDEVKGNAVRYHGVFVETLANGDKLHVNYTGTGTIEQGHPQTGVSKWSVASGTGKLKGAKGQGTCNGKSSPDSYMTFTCEGEYTLAK
jgi:hypothetical protein